MTDPRQALRTELKTISEKGSLGVVAAMSRIAEGRLRAWVEGDDAQLEETDVMRLAAQLVKA
jgi:hypothetical protein